VTMLDASQISQYEEKGYVVVPGVLDADEIAELRQVTEEYSGRAQAGDVDAKAMDIGVKDGQNYLRRIKSPHLHHPVYEKVMRHPRLLEVVADLIGPDIRLYGTKLNLKLPSGSGDAIQWHQDWAFYPHTNDHILAAGVMLDDMTEQNGPLLVVTGSQRGEVYSHHANGYFVGALDPDPIKDMLGTAEVLTGPAGSVSFHHVRVVHASGPNRSTGPRRIIFQNYAAADAWPLVGCGSPGDGHVCPGSDFEGYKNLIVAGEHREARMEQGPVVLPLPGPPDSSSVFTTQMNSGRVYFD
jgi:ectoine hydroxylase-related dioxygenase (phytanoyl-CoA dioxygenase family)